MRCATAMRPRWSCSTPAGATWKRRTRRLNATIWLDREGAEQAARAADRAVRDKAWLGPLHGVPMVHKDMYYQAGRLSTCGSALRRDWRPDGHRHRDREAERGRRLYVRRPQHGGVRAEPDRSQSRRSATATTRGTCPTSPAARRPAPAPRWRRGSTTWRWAPTPAVRSGCRRRRAASPASSRRRPACRATASCRCRSAPTMSGRSRAPRATAPAS